ncbi:hypothetical protein ABFS83_03G051500 [Erythranthe nasuta]
MRIKFYIFMEFSFFHESTLVCLYIYIYTGERNSPQIHTWSKHQYHEVMFCTKIPHKRSACRFQIRSSGLSLVIIDFFWSCLLLRFMSWWSFIPAVKRTKAEEIVGGWGRWTYRILPREERKKERADGTVYGSRERV